MKKLMLISMLLPTLVMAYDLNGALTDRGNGNYSVNVENNYGHEYTGDARDTGNDSLDVTVEDAEGQSYSGTASKSREGTYDLDLQNDSSGGSASGTLALTP